MLYAIKVCTGTLGISNQRFGSFHYPSVLIIKLLLNGRWSDYCMYINTRLHSLMRVKIAFIEYVPLKRSFYSLILNLTHTYTATLYCTYFMGSTAAVFYIFHGYSLYVCVQCAIQFSAIRFSRMGGGLLKGKRIECMADVPRATIPCFIPCMRVSVMIRGQQFSQ